MRAVDLYAGAGGWSIPCRYLGVAELGFENWSPAIRTRNAAGLDTVRGDLTQHLPTDDRWGAHEVLLASPPCQSLSVGGKRDGLAQMSALCGAIRSGDDSALEGGVRHMVEPMRWIKHRIMSEQPFKYIAFEQVPTVIPAWEAYADVLEEFGYSIDLGVLNAADYGVPQTRKRAILVASLEGRAALPPATVKTPVGFAEALELAGDWSLISNYTHGGTGLRGVRESPAPSWTLTGRCTRMYLAPGHVGMQKSTKGIAGGRRLTVAEAGVLQSFPKNYPWRGTTDEDKTLQIGNAAPPKMTGEILAHLLPIEPECGLHWHNAIDEGVSRGEASADE